jgi:hypothetical protein
MIDGANRNHAPATDLARSAGRNETLFGTDRARQFEDGLAAFMLFLVLGGAEWIARDAVPNTQPGATISASRTGIRWH